MSNGAFVCRASIPPCGIENGLWLKSIVPSSDNSYIGKSTIKQNLYTPFSTKSNLFPNSSLTPPAIFCAFLNSSAIKKIAVLGFAPICSNPNFTSSVINFAIPPVTSFSASNFTQAKPFASNSFIAYSLILSKNFLPCSAPFSTNIAFIVFSLKALNSVFSNNFVTSCIINGFLKSGLSLPYFSIASLYGIRGNGVFVISQLVCFLNIVVNISSNMFNTSSCSAKLISKSN